ncbi:5-anhydro-D-fructose reductase [Seminavis robusta]|uniref:5-anhydro-D-fructose reductase n=1 Tax=Seminavis robusta TaxID=568900 RepID=A0A9N8DK00_9STRA|nr:5-anhydro-D-fructose reductase [Seminavis robusta]|eukprot:Sro128_g061010.1 5-anhydro-D-fructose reductase (386) ;mRNA; f:3459-4616
MDPSSSSKTTTTIKWGIVGLGDVCQTKSGPAFFKCQGSDLVAVMRRTPGKAAEWVAQQSPQGSDCQGYDNLDAFLQHPSLQAVYISTRPGTHLELCRKVAEAGKAVYVEKPVGRCAAEAMEMAALCQQAGVPFYTAYISRAYERTLAIRKLLADPNNNIVGDTVTQIQYTLVGNGGARGMEQDGQSLPWRLIAKEAGGGLIMDVGCHVIDRIDYLCGPLHDVQGQAENRASRDLQKVEDYVHFDAKIGPSDWAATSSEGASVSCTWDFTGATAEERDELVLTGPKGSLRMAGMSANGPIEVLDTSGTVIRTIDDFVMPQHTAQGLIQAVTNDMRGLDVHPPCLVSRADNAIRTQKVIDTVLASYYGGREVGYWDRSPESWPGYHS